MGKLVVHWRWLALLGSVGIISMLIWRTTAQRPSLPQTLPVWGTSAISRDGTLVASSTVDGIAVWRLPQLQQLAHIVTPDAGKALSMAWNPDGSALAIAGDALVIYRIADGQPTVVTRDYAPQVPQVAWSQSGTVVALGYSGMIDLWHMPDLRPFGRLMLPTDPSTSRVNALDLSADGTLLATSSSDRQVRLWQVADGRVLREFSEQESEPGRVAISPDGQLVAVGVETMIHVWRIADGRRVHRLQGHSERVTTITWSPDGQWIASGAGNTQSIEYADTSGLVVNVWSAISGTLDQTFTGHHRPVTGVMFAPDGDGVLSIDGMGDVHTWRLR
jgi:WD40 repeat protein